jgi:general secretion pathway protein G
MPLPSHTPRRPERGFTLVELLIVISIIAILAGLVVPFYLAAVRGARVVKAKEELRMISSSIDMFRAKHNGVLPVTLIEVGHRGRRDPWGYPYMYLNFSTGTGSGMDWATKNNLIDPSALPPGMEPDPEGDGTVDSTAGFDFNTYEMAKVGADILPVLPAGTQITVDEVKRKDQFLFPLNTDYDLFSMGPNHATAASLGETISLDDVIRANNGGFFGQASDY